jgi:SNW domain-containing protein 1
VTSDGKTGEARFDAIVAAQHPDKKLHSRFSDLVERRPDLVVQMRPSEEEEAATAARTSATLGQIISAKILSTRPGHVAETAQSRAEESKMIRYTPAPDAPGYNPATAQRIIRMVDAPVDPFEPSKFKHKKVPGGPPDAPVPVMRRCGPACGDGRSRVVARCMRCEGHSLLALMAPSPPPPLRPPRSPPRKTTVADQEAWKIPPAISNWKNTKGYIVPLDKRLAVDGRSMLEPTISDGFAKLSESLLIAERKARVEVETRAAIQRKLTMKDKEAKEEELRALAARARMERTGVAQIDASGGGAAAGSSRLPPSSFSAGGTADDVSDVVDQHAQPARASRAAAAGLLGAAVAGAPPGGGRFGDSGADGGDDDDDGVDAEGAAARERLRLERKREREKVSVRVSVASCQVEVLDRAWSVPRLSLAPPPSSARLSRI